MITITNKQLAGSSDAFQMISHARDGIEASAIQKFARWMRKINDELEGFNEARNELLKRHWKTGEDGERLPEFVAKNMDEFEADMKKFMDQTIELQLVPFDLTMLGKKPVLTIGQQMALDWWIKQEPETEE